MVLHTKLVACKLVRPVIALELYGENFKSKCRVFTKWGLGVAPGNTNGFYGVVKSLTNI
jgi:hypothetical protein